MSSLKAASDYAIGETPIHWARRFCPQGHLALKLEQLNATGSVKARTAYFIFMDLIKRHILTPNVKIVESTSGNLGLALSALGREIGIDVVCLVDPTISEHKVQRLGASGAEVRIIELCGHEDYRSARIAEAKRLSSQQGWIWPNQYDNEAGMQAHESTTGPEIWNALSGRVDFVVGSVGTGGTLLGIARALKARRTEIKAVAVEPKGSTIFGGSPGNYLSAGAGLRQASPLLCRHADVIDYFAKVGDDLAIRTSLAVAKTELMAVGVTAGAAIAVATHLAIANPDQVVVAIVPDGGDNYNDILKATPASPEQEASTLTLFDASMWRLGLSVQ
jgi:cysteine synthase